MNFDCIIANPPYSKIGCDITKNVIKQNPDSNYAMLGTRSMFKAFYKDTLACAFVQIGRYELGSNQKLDWGVEQAILLATNGWTEVVDNRKKVGENKVGIDQLSPSFRGFSIGRISHLVGVNHIWLDHTGCMGQTRNAHLVQTSQGQIPQEAYTRLRNATLVQINRSDTIGAAATHSRSVQLVDMTQSPCTMTHLRTETLDKSVDVKLRNGYTYVAFETFEEACECAIDIISWKNPTDSHYRCVRWGFVQELKAHEKSREHTK